MQQETKITKERIRHHLAYGWWKYLLLGVIAIFGWNLIYTASAYQAPGDKKLDVYFASYSLAEDVLEEMKAAILERRPNLEDADILSIYYSETDDYYGSVQLTTYIGAGEGDVFILTKDRFDVYARGGLFLPLDDAIASGAIDLRGIDPARGVVTTEDGVRGVMGIPAERLYGLMDIGLDSRELLLGVTAYSENPEDGFAFIDWLIAEMDAPKPEWLVEQERIEAEANVTQGVSDIPSF